MNDLTLPMTDLTPAGSGPTTPMARHTPPMIVATLPTTGPDQH